MPLNTLVFAGYPERSISRDDLLSLIFGRRSVSRIRTPELFLKCQEAVVAGIGLQVPGSLRVSFRALGGQQVLGPSGGSRSNFPVVDRAHGSESSRVGNGSMQ